MKSYVYVLILKDTSMLKIGKADNVFKRIKQLKKVWGEFDLERSFVFECDFNYVNKLERLLHGVFYYDRIKGLKKGDGYTEIFHSNVLYDINNVVSSLSYAKYIKKIMISNLGLNEEEYTEKILVEANGLLNKYTKNDIENLVKIMLKKINQDPILYKSKLVKDFDNNDSIHFFRESILQRTPNMLRDLYSDLKDIYIKENLKLEELNEFFRYIILGSLPVGKLSTLFMLYFKYKNNNVVSPQKTAKILTIFFGKTYKRKIFPTDKNASRIKIIGSSLNPIYLNEIVKGVKN